MGIIIKQSIKGTIWSYLGVIIGFITTAYLYPNYLSPEIVGLFALLVAWPDLFIQFSFLGFHGVTNRLFPYFRNKSNGHNGFVFIAFMVLSVGFLLFLLVYFLMKSWLVESNLEKSALFAHYIDLIIPITLFALLFGYLDVLNRLLYDAVFGPFLKEFVQRVLILIILVLYIFGWLTPHELILTYAGMISLKGAIIFLYLLLRKELSFKPRFDFIDKKLKREMISVAIYSILGSIGGSIVFQLDKIIINQVMGLNATGVYTIAFFFGTLVVIPSRTLLRISGTLIAEAWKNGDLDTITDIYKKSCLNQFIIAAFLFGGIWINIDNILIILGPDYEAGKWVIFFIGLGYLIDMATGANSNIISLSKYYKVGLWFLIILVVLVVSSMLLFIPLWGLSGAAAAIALAFLLNNVMRFLFLKIKFGMQPFTVDFIKIAFISILLILLIRFIPEFRLIPDILMRSTFFTILFGLPIYFLKISKDINQIADNFMVRVRSIVKK